MKAYIRRGKYKGFAVEISQWCNDWFTTKTGTDIDRRPFSPSQLVFTKRDMNTILKHKDNGMLLEWFEPTEVPSTGPYFLSFKRK